MSKNSHQKDTPRPVVFLDTNAVHYSKITLALGAARTFDVLAEDVDAFRDQLREWGVGAVDHYENGYWIIRYLARRCEQGADLLYSPMTQLELLCGSLKGEAIKRAVNVGVPNRWFSRIAESEIRDHLEPDGYGEVGARQAGIDELFDEANITLSAPPLNSEVWQLAQAVMENVFIDVQDCVVYASALVNQADALVTTDGYLSDTVCWTRNPGSARDSLKERFQSLKDALISAYAAMTGCEESNVVFPEEIGIRKMKQFLNGASA